MLRSFHPLAAPLALATTLALTACQPAADSTPAADGERQLRGSLAFTPCTLDGAGSFGNVEARCATLEVPEDRATPTGRKISLKIAWLPSENSGDATTDPVFFIAGGPGQSATGVAGYVEKALATVSKQRDIFLVDQRGTGGSNPLTCVDADGKALPFDEKAAPTPAVLAEYAGRCAAALEGRADPRFYTTTEAIADLDAVRAALGAEQVNLIGVSYGTRVAQQYAKQYATHTRSLVLDGVAPNDLVVGGEFANTFEDAIVLQSEQCRKDAQCAERFPTDTRAQLQGLMTRLRQAPVEVEYRHPGTGVVEKGTLSADTVVSLAFMFSYTPELTALLPLTLDEAAQGRYAPLMSLAGLSGKQMDEQMNRAMQWSVICAEDADRYTAPASSDRLLGNEVASMFFAACSVWPKGARPADFTTPLTGDVPVLLLSGQFDPVTPPQYAERVAKGLPKGRALVARGQGHGTLMAGCMPRLVSQFIEDTDAAALDVTCLDTLSDVPAFTSFNGWQP